MLGLSVEAAFGYSITSASPAWTDLTDRVDLVSGINIERGAQDELSETQAGTATLTLDDSDGALTPARSGPFSPNVKKNVPIRIRTVTADQNLITNPSFESGLADWNKSASPTIVQDATHVKHGSQALRVTWGSASSESVFTEVYGLDIGKTYTGSAYVWVPTGAPAMEAHIEGMALGTASTVFDAWQRITYTFAATATHHRFVLQQVGTPTAGTQCWIDAVQLWEGASALPLNHVTNPDFETGTTGWQLGSDAATSFVQSAVRAQRGSKSLLVTWGGALNSNPDFETTLSPWTGNGATAARVNTQAQAGTWSAQITPDGVSQFPRMESELFAVTAGVSYKAEGYLRCVTARQVALNINWFDAGFAYISTSANQQSVTANTWTLFSATFAAPANAAYAQLAPTVPNTPPATDVLYVDEVRFLLSTGNQFPAVETPVNGLVVGQQYTASAYVWVPTGSRPCQLFIVGIGGTGPASTLNDAWQRITYTFTATATSHTLQLIPSGNPKFGKQVWMDAVQLELGSTATALNPLDGARIHGRFFGMVNQWPVTWKGLQAKVTITCTDVFKWARLDDELRPMLSQEVLLDRPIVYYPLVEPADSTSAGDLSGTASVAALAITQAGVGGTLTFAAGTGPNSLPCPQFTPASSSAGKYLTADLGPNVMDANTPWRVRAEAWFSTSTNGRVLMALASTDGGTKVVILLEAGTGKLALEKDQGGNGNQSYVFATPNLADGALHHMVYNENEHVLYIDGVSYSLTSYTGDQLRMLSVGGYQNARLWSGTIAHVAVYFRAVTAAELAGHYTTGTTAHVGESAAARISRLASYTGLTVTSQGTVFDPMASQADLGKSALAHMRDIETTESGKLLADRSSASLVFQSRDLRYNPMPAISLQYADLETDGLEYADDDQKMVNDVTASRPGGATQRIISQTAIDTYGPKPRTLDLYKNSDNSVTDAANWLVSRYSDPPPEIRQVSVEAYSLPLATYRALLDADVSTVLGVTALPDQAPAATATLVVEGYSEQILQGRHPINFRTSRADTDNVWVLDDPTYSVLGSTTRLAY